MTTCRELIVEALERFGALAPGDGLTADEVVTGLRVVQQAVYRYIAGRPPLTDVDVTEDYTAGENERIRVQAGYTVSVTMPNSISTTSAAENDYGFRPSSRVLGSDAVADGISYRAPRDGSCNEVTHLTSATAPVLYIYRADINTWVNCAALEIDGSMPLNSGYLQDFASMIAVTLCQRWTSREIIPSRQMKADEAMARARLYGRFGVTRDPVRAQYF